MRITNYIGLPLADIFLGSFFIGASILLAKPQFKIEFTSRTTFIVGLLFLFSALLNASILGNYTNYDPNSPNSFLAVLPWLLIFIATALTAIYYGIKSNDSVVYNFGVTFLIIHVYAKFFNVAGIVSISMYFSLFW